MTRSAPAKPPDDKVDAERALRVVAISDNSGSSASVSVSAMTSVLIPLGKLTVSRTWGDGVVFLVADLRFRLVSILGRPLKRSTGDEWLLSATIGTLNVYIQSCT